jgi:hypothetical protein
MKLRDLIIRNQHFGAAAAVGLLLTSIVILLLQLRGPRTPTTPTMAFFTIDDGKTWFADDATNIPPYDKDGKIAVRAFVQRCADGTQFVNYLERFKPTAKQALESLNTADPNQKKSGNLAAIQSAYAGGREVKRPGEKNWTDGGNFRAAAAVIAVKCPNGGDQAVAVEP